MGNEEYNEETTLEYLDEKIRTAKDGKDAEGFAKAYQAKKEADTLEWREAKKLDVERQKNKYTFIGNVLGSVLGSITGTGLAAFIKMKGDLVFQKNAQVWEDAGHYVNYRKGKR